MFHSIPSSNGGAVVGEYGDLLLEAPPDEEHGIAHPPSEEQVLEIYQRVLWNPQNSNTTKQYALMSLTKLSTRFQATTSHILQAISSFRCSLHIELQQRGVEFSQLFGQYAHLRPALLER